MVEADIALLAIRGRSIVAIPMPIVVRIGQAFVRVIRSGDAFIDAIISILEHPQIRNVCRTMTNQRHCTVYIVAMSVRIHDIIQCACFGVNICPSNDKERLCFVANKQQGFSQLFGITG